MAQGPGTLVALQNLQERMESCLGLLEALEGRSTCVKVVLADAFRDQLHQATQDLATARAAMHIAMAAERTAQQEEQQRGLSRGLSRAFGAVRPGVVRQASTPAIFDQSGLLDSPVGRSVGLGKSRFGSATRVF
ncbi:hypothetical protein HYH03_007890 [Edaphochlamys debaryana]|uniref:Uncharacterized protein n=1 Tax=Edaphochlamys debaryana TaxID=47281 RepID=A0A836BYU6_9CHLO|nr:hypothetical protein HYH03_007890 [Edaphochlamys debaryana]|eukprot:KAG2493960.1 hypothetical protein HYH03_007890 [Edaphochlamys debaryana]